MHTITFQAPDKMNKALEKYAKEFKLSKAHLLRQGLEQYLEDLADIAAVKRARRKNGSQPTIPFEEVKRRLDLP